MTDSRRSAACPEEPAGDPGDSGGPENSGDDPEGAAGLTGPAMSVGAPLSTTVPPVSRARSRAHAAGEASTSVRLIEAPSVVRSAAAVSYIQLTLPKLRRV